MWCGKEFLSYWQVVGSLTLPFFQETANIAMGHLIIYDSGVMEAYVHHNNVTFTISSFLVFESFAMSFMPVSVFKLFCLIFYFWLIFYIVAFVYYILYFPITVIFFLHQERRFFLSSNIRKQTSDLFNIAI